MGRKPTARITSTPVSGGASALLASALTDDAAATALLAQMGVASLSPSLTPQQTLVNALSQVISQVNVKEVSSRVASSLLSRYEFIRVASSPSPADTRRGSTVLYSKTPEALCFVRHSLPALKQEMLAIAGVWLRDSEAEEVLNSFINTVPIITGIERRFIAVAPNLYWDEDSQTLVPQVPQNNACFIRLFDSPSRVGGGIVSYPLSSYDETFADLVQEEYATTLANLRSLAPNEKYPTICFDLLSDEMPRAFHFIEEWANDDPGVYWDIMTMLATVFMKHKPLGAYFLIGESRNGKSSCVSLAHSIFGVNNTSRVQLSKLGDPHFFGTLTTSILNAPDDENDDITRHQGEFKQLAGHQLFSGTQLFSNTPLQINGGDMTFIFPMNTLPRWKGTSAAACSKRTIPIPFLHDFSTSSYASDSRTNSFELTTYTKDTLGRIAAQAMALATFYDEHPEAFGYSPASISQKGYIAEDNNNVALYRKEFETFFCGFQNKALLYDDYRYWCNQKEFRYEEVNSVNLAFQAYFNEKYRGNKVYANSANTKVKKKCRRAAYSNSRSLPLMEDLYIPEFKMTVEQLHGCGMSAVFALKDYYDTDTDEQLHL